MQYPISVTGIMLRNAGKELIVEAEINGRWVVVIREWVGPMEFAVSHIVEPLGIQRRMNESLNTVVPEKV